MIRIQRILAFVATAVIALSACPRAWAGGAGPSDWAGMADVVLTGTLSGVKGGNGKVVTYFMQPDEIWADPDKKIGDIPILEVLSGVEPENCAVMVAYLTHLDGNQFIEIGSVCLQAAGQKGALLALQEWTDMGRTSMHKIKPEYKDLLIRNLESGNPTLVKFATEELMYVTRMLSVKDGKAIESALYKSTDPYIRERLCMRLIAQGDPVFLPTWVQVTGEQEDPKTLVNLLRRFKPAADDPNHMHERLGRAINEKLRSFETLLTGGAENEIKDAELATRGLKQANMAYAAGELRLTDCIPSLMKRFDMEKPGVDTLQQCMIALGRMQADGLLPHLEQYRSDPRLTLASAASIGKAYWCAREGTDEESLRLRREGIGMLTDLLMPVRTSPLPASLRNRIAPVLPWFNPDAPRDNETKLMQVVALKGLSVYRSSETDPILITFLNTETDPELINAVLDECSEAPRGDLLKAMIGLLDRPMNEQVHLRLVDFFAERATQSAVPGMWTLLKNPANSLKLREMCFQAIGMLGNQKDRKQLAGFVKEIKELRRQQEEKERKTK